MKRPGYLQQVCVCIIICKNYLSVGDNKRALKHYSEKCVIIFWQLVGMCQSYKKHCGLFLADNFSEQ